jgi:hypothetical protein
VCKNDKYVKYKEELKNEEKIQEYEIEINNNKV